jgi:hypothetical protein
MNEIDHFKVCVLYNNDVTTDVDHLHIKRINLVGLSYIVIEDSHTLCLGSPRLKTEKMVACTFFGCSFPAWSGRPCPRRAGPPDSLRWRSLYSGSSVKLTPEKVPKTGKQC